LNLIELIKSGRKDFRHKASMGRMGAACVVSAGYGIIKGNTLITSIYIVRMKTCDRVAVKKIPLSVDFC
jgi:hypothetical protein